ncbi:MAG TPA: peptidylprolyl isomerase [Acidimicrobiia bacterium]|nr:peptidylprolyl isomerase [Acidimicrobiia bacterium]HEX2192910.1 peptidylprolyl isomerase [Acidimicrobiales bacterium]
MATTKSRKRQRQKQSRSARQAAILRARQRRSRRNRVMVAGFLALVLVLGIATLVSGGKESEDRCPKPDGSSPRTTRFAAPPPPCIDAARTYVAEMVTNKGTITITLDPRRAPTTVNNFVVLARYHFYDGLTFHRVVPGFVIQGGDPQGTGGGNPGYTFGDELPEAGQYKVGSVAMANSGPNTNGSQFFIVSGDTGVGLEPKYSLFGEVTAGLDVVKSIEALGNPEDQTGRPRETVTIQSVTIKES